MASRVLMPTGEVNVEVQISKGGDASLLNTVFNFINTIIGSGIIGLPFSVSEAGLPLGIIEIIVFALLTDFSINILIESGILARKTEYQELCETVFGRAGWVMCTIFMFGFAFGAMISYLVIVGDSVPATFAVFLGADHILANRVFMLVIPTVVIMLPLSCLRTIDKLSKTSAVSLLCVLAITIIIIVAGVQYQFSDQYVVPPGAWNFAKSNFLQATGVISFAYVCQHNSFLLFSELKNNNLKRWRLGTHVSVFVAMIASIILAVVGYVTFFDETHGNILNNFDSTLPIIIAGRLLFAITMFLTFPLEVFVARFVLCEWVSSCRVYRGRSRLQFYWPVHIGMTIGLVGVALLLAIIVGSNLGVVLELCGSINAVALSLIFPPFCYLKLAPGPLRSPKKIVCLILLWFGVFDAISSTLLIILGVALGVSRS